MFRQWSAVLAACLALAACNEKSAPAGVELDEHPVSADGSVEEPDAGRPVCTSDEDCSDHTFCTGVERCLPAAPGADARGCIVVEPACEQGSSCLESEARCKPCAEDDDLDDDTVPGIACGGTDCADDDPERFPGNPELCDRGHDEDCNLKTFGERDLDHDGYFDSSCFNTDGAAGTDCNDANASVHPTLPEVCNGIDDNCNGETDEGLLTDYYPDRDWDEQGDRLADGGLPEAQPSCANEPGLAEAVRDCDPEDPTRNESQLEFCDGVDNDCDEAIDESKNDVVWYRDEDGDGFGDARKPVKYSCYPPGEGWSILKRDCDDGDPEVNPSAPEICDGKDNNCNGRADFFVPGHGYEDDDGDGKADQACARSEPDCDDGDYTSYPGAPELCDGRDNDCDGKADVGAAPVRWYVDVDGDGFGDERAFIESCAVVSGRVPRAGDCADDDPTRSPARADDCGGAHGADDDCDGEVDEDEQRAPWFLDEDGDGAGAGEPAVQCFAPAQHVASAGDCAPGDEDVGPQASEVCGDQRDNDCDGFADCDDSACYGEPACKVEAEIVLKAGDGQSARVGEELPRSIQVLVRDGSTRAPLSSRAVSLLASGGTGPSQPASRTFTDAWGVATFVVRAGRKVGIETLRVTSERARPLSLTVHVTAPEAQTPLTLVNASKVAGTGLANAQSAIATWTRPGSVSGVVSARDGTLYVSSDVDGKIYRVTPEGVMQHVAGGADDFADDVPATDTAMTPRGLALDESDPQDALLYLADARSARVRVVALRTGIINTVAGGGTAGAPDFGDGQAATSAQLKRPAQLALVGNALYVSDDEIEPVRKIDLAQGVIEAVTPTPSAGLKLCACTFGCALAAGPQGDLFVAAQAVGSDVQDPAGQCDGTRGTAIVRIEADGSVHHVAGRRLGAASDGVAAVASTLPNPLAMAFDAAGNLYYGGDARVRRIDGTTGVVRTVLGDGTEGSTGDYGVGVARVRSVSGLAFFEDHLLVADSSAASLRSVWQLGAHVPTAVTATLDSSAVMNGQILKPAGKLTVRVAGASGAPLSQVAVSVRSASKGARVETPIALTGTDGRASSIVWPGRAVQQYDLEALVEDIHGRAASATLSVKLMASTPPVGTVLPLVNVNRDLPQFTSDGRAINGVPGPAVAARIGTPDALALAPDGTLYVASTSLHAIYTVSPEGEIGLLAGSGTGATGSTGNGGPASRALLNTPTALALDAARSRLYVADAGNNAIRSIALSNNPPTIDYVTTVNRITGLATTSQGDLYVAKDNENSDDGFRRVPVLQQSLLETVLPGSNAAFAGELHFVSCAQNCAVAADAADALVVSGTMNGPPFEGTLNPTGNAVARWLPGSGLALHYLAGAPNTGDPNAAPFLYNVRSIATIESDVYFVEPDMSRVHRVDAGGLAPVIAGGGNELGDYGSSEALRLSQPEAIVITPEGHLVIADTKANKVRLVWGKAEPSLQP